MKSKRSPYQKELKASSLAALRQKTINDVEQVPEIVEIPCSLPPNVDAVTVGAGHLKGVQGVALLPNGNVLVADEVAGLVLFSFDGRILKTVGERTLAGKGRSSD